MFDTYLARWNLLPDGSPIFTRSARLLPVRRQGEPAMLKLATEQEERFGGLLVEWWNGDGAARVRPVATEPGRFARRLEVVAEAARLERERLLRWILAWTGLSAAWFLGDGDSAAIDLRVAELPAAELDRCR